MGIGYEGRKGQLEERVDGDAASIDGCYACWCHDDGALFALFDNGLQKGGLSRTSLTCQEDAASCVFHKIPRLLQGLVLFCRLILFHSSFRIK